MGVPVVREYKYLGTWISPRTKDVVDKAVKSVRKYGGMIAERTRSLPPEVAMRALSGFTLGKILYQLAPLFIVGLLTGKDIQQIYRKIICRGTGLSRSAEIEDLLERLGMKRLTKTLEKFSKSFSLSSMPNTEEQPIIKSLEEMDSSE